MSCELHSCLSHTDSCQGRREILMLASLCSCRQDENQGNCMNVSWYSAPSASIPGYNTANIITLYLGCSALCIWLFFYRARKSSGLLISLNCQRDSGRLPQRYMLSCIARADGSQGAAWLLLPQTPGWRKINPQAAAAFHLEWQEGRGNPSHFSCSAQMLISVIFFHTCNWKTNNCPLSTQGEVSYYRMIFKCVLLSCYIQLCSFKSSFSTWLLSFKLPIAWASWFQLLPMFFVGHVFYFFSYSTFSL